DFVERVSPVVSSSNSSTLIFVNDRIDLAVGVGANGVHLGDRDLPPEVARKILRDRKMLLGVSTHSVEEAIRMARSESVDYVAIGPIFSSGTKMVRDPLGLESLERARERIEKPIVAIGGINRSNIARVLAAGADSAAVVGALYEGGSIEDNVEAMIARAREGMA
ncbi:MAG: thiamine phosphate synthase, partial [Thermoanaerobaculia bacterium]|nr:thiamine phosphate synthase [Thermoanaerobaculia bacterium]